MAHPAYSSPTATQPYTSQMQAPNYPLYAPTGTQGQLPQPMRSVTDPSQSFNQQSPLSTNFNPLSVSQGNAALQSLAGAMQQSTPSGPSNVLSSAFGSSMYDLYDPSQFDFDPASFNFGNHYGAMEFGMLGQMSSGAAESPPNLLDQQYNTSQPGIMAGDYHQQTPVNLSQQIPIDQTPRTSNWQDPQNDSPIALQRQNTQSRPPTQSSFTIGANSSLTSPNSTSSPQTATPLFDDRPGQEATG